MGKENIKKSNRRSWKNWEDIGDTMRTARQKDGEGKEVGKKNCRKADGARAHTHTHTRERQ